MSAGSRDSGPRVLLALVAATLGGGCATSIYLTDCEPVDRLACPRASEVERVAGPVAVSVFLVGDAGYAGESGAVVKRRPLVFERLRSDLEAKLATSDTVLVAFLGDNIYPNGLRDGTGDDGACPGSPYCSADREQLDAQLNAVPAGVGAYFIAGNHDWANTAGETAYPRVLNQGEYLEGTPAELVPSAGCPGPVVKDVLAGDERRLRLIFLDTQWLLLPEGSRPDQSSTPPPPCPGVTEEQVYEGLRDGFQAAGEAPVLLFAHHPIRTHSSHGGHGSGLSKLAGLLGWSAQDLNSRPYRRLIGRLEPILAEAATAAESSAVVVAGGHDHALQVMYGSDTGAHYLVSGSGSKLSDVGDGDDLEFAAGLPGYMRVDVLEDGGVLLYVTAGCPPLEPSDAPGGERTHDGGLTCRVGDVEVAFVKRLE